MRLGDVSLAAVQALLIIFRLLSALYPEMHLTSLENAKKGHQLHASNAQDIDSTVIQAGVDRASKVEGRC